MSIRLPITCAVFAMAAVAATSAFAQVAAPLRIVVGVQAGGSTDTLARILAERMRGSLSEAIIVENKPGATQRVAMVELLRSPADGRTILLGSNALYSIIPHIYGAETGFDPFRDVTPLSRVAAVQVGISTGQHINASDIAEFVVWAKANPGKATYATPGAGSTSHFIGIALAKALGIEMTHVPYRGSAPAITDLMGGHVALVITAISDLTEFARAGKVKVLATAGPKRAAAMPETRTLVEQGVNVSFEAAFDAYAKAGAPPAEVRRLNAALVTAVRDPDVSAKLSQLGNEPVGGTPDELLEAQKAEFTLWEAPVKESGFKGE